MMDINQISDWITDAKKGEQAIYYTGYLAKDRGNRKSVLSRVANYVWAMEEEGLVLLSQKKTPNCTKQHSEFYYIMHRSKKDRI